MTRTIRNAGLAGVLTALTLAAGVAIAGPDAAGPPDGPRQDHAARMAEELQLDETQVTALETMRETIQADREAAQGELEAIRLEMEAELSAEETNERAVHKLIDQKLEVQSDLAHGRMDAFLDFRATLSPDQKAELDELMKERHARKAQRKGAHKGHKRPGQDGPLWEDR